MPITVDVANARVGEVSEIVSKGTISNESTSEEISSLLVHYR